MKILLTGATSFIGLRLTERLISGGNEVAAVIRPNSPNRSRVENIFSHYPEKNLIILESDMKHYSELPRIIEKESFYPDFVVALSWNGTRGSDRNDYGMQRKNYLANMELLRSANAMGCSGFMTAGSQAEYGPGRLNVSEKDECRPNTEYGKWKLKLYEDASVFCKENGMRLIEPRLFSIYGEGDYEGTLIYTALRKMLEGEDCHFTESTQMWDYLYIDDLVEGLFSLIDGNAPSGAYNMGYGSPRPLKEFILEMARITDTKSKLNFGTVPYPATGPVDVSPDISKIRNTTGWYPKVTFSEGIRRIIGSMRN
jgi:nucleoside-diphosphate-sugar epimerase